MENLHEKFIDDIKKEIFALENEIRRKRQYLNALKYYVSVDGRGIRYFDVVDDRGIKRMCSWSHKPREGQDYYDHNNNHISDKYYD